MYCDVKVRQLLKTFSLLISYLDLQLCLVIRAQACELEVAQEEEVSSSHWLILSEKSHTRTSLAVCCGPEEKITNQKDNYCNRHILCRFTVTIDVLRDIYINTCILFKQNKRDTPNHAWLLNAHLFWDRRRMTLRVSSFFPLYLFRLSRILLYISFLLLCTYESKINHCHPHVGLWPPWQPKPLFFFTKAETSFPK